MTHDHVRIIGANTRRRYECRSTCARLSPRAYRSFSLGGISGFTQPAPIIRRGNGVSEAATTPLTHSVRARMIRLGRLEHVARTRSSLPDAVPMMTRTGRTKHRYMEARRRFPLARQRRSVPAACAPGREREECIRQRAFRSLPLTGRRGGAFDSTQSSIGVGGGEREANCARSDLVPASRCVYQPPPPPMP